MTLEEAANHLTKAGFYTKPQRTAGIVEGIFCSRDVAPSRPGEMLILIENVFLIYEENGEWIADLGIDRIVTRSASLAEVVEAVILYT